MLFANLAFGTVGIFFAYLVDYAFKLPAIYYGILFIILTFGLIVGSIAGSRVKGKIGFYNALLILTMGALLISIGFIGTIYLDFAVVFIIGTTIGIVNVISQTGILKKVDQGMIARVYGAFSTFGLSVTFLSGGIGGLLIDYITLRWSFVFIGGILAIVAAVSVFFREYYNISI
jgi:MFS family permease